ncbi:FecCD family ABC transporter permease [Dietzia sp.]|uniref:FecCD family ABC transporter permease n=1 Tax=Dietzia sp. TaxID=1871616 RepID=UPI002FD93265
MPVAPWVLTAALAVLLVASIAGSLAFGSERLPLGDVLGALRARTFGGPTPSFAVDAIVWDLRLPRALLAAVAGAGLAVAGAAMQTLVRNPLADPYLLGVSSGASVGATAVLTTGALSGLGVYALSGGALLGALAASFAVFLIASAQGGLTPLRLVLSGVVLSAAFSALSSFLVFLSPEPRAAESVMFWLLGSVAGATWVKIPIVAVVVCVALAAMLAIHGWLDALAAGEETAHSLGVPVRALRIALFVLQAVVVGAVVAVAGGIGFIGLIAPHVARLVVGARHRVMLPVAALGGALFVVWVDTISRVLVAPQEMPLGVVTGIVGAPVFLLLMGRSRYSFGGQR